MSPLVLSTEKRLYRPRSRDRFSLASSNKMTTLMAREAVITAARS